MQDGERKMDSVDRPFAALAAMFGGLGVVLGAFGAHALQARLDPASLQAWHTAVEYQFWHALALLVVALHARSLPFSRVIETLFSVGIVFFCGSLYAIALGAPHLLGAVAPVGGLAFIGGWFLLGFAFLRRTSR
jgi:uncharacterized membrane protein YgdD (TMEM256/DUF423 family)